MELASEGTTEEEENVEAVAVGLVDLVDGFVSGGFFGNGSLNEYPFNGGRVAFHL